MSLPRILLMATGGTIAGAADDRVATTGYRAGSLRASALLDAVPEIHERAQLAISQPFSLDSRDLGPAHWLQLARELGQALDDPAIDAAVVTHGTDTLEETAFLLDRLLAPGKPVVMTCAMRPASARSADGPLNLLQAVSVAACPAAHNLGVTVVANDRIHAASRLRKAHTQALDAFDHAESAIGWANPPRIDRLPLAPPRRPELLAGLETLPRVDVLWVGAGSDPDLVAASIAHGARGLVLALPGNGSLPSAWRPQIGKAVALGIPVLRASRTATGRITPEPDDGDTLIAAGACSPAQARVALMLALAGGLAPGYFLGA